MRHLYKRYFVISLLFAGVSYGQADSAHNMAAFTNCLNAVIDEAISRNPQLKASRYKIEEAEKSVTLNKALYPPQINYESMWPANKFKQSEYALSFEQMLPFPGKLSAKAGIEKQKKNMAESDSRTLERDLVRKIKDAFYEVYLIDRKLVINAENREFAKRAIDIASRQYEVGTGPQADILRGQTELSNLLNDEIVLKQARESANAMICALTGRPPLSNIETVPEVRPAYINVPYTTLEACAFQNRSELASMKSALAMTQAELAMNKKERYPDFMVRGEYRNMTQTGMASLGAMAGMTFPVAPWSEARFSSAIAQNRLQLLESEAEIENMRSMIRFEVQDALLRVNSAQEQIRLLESTVIPQSRQTLESTLSAYQNGKTGFLMLIDAERMLLDAQEKYHMAVMQHLSATAALERSAGISLEAIQEKQK